MLKIALCLITTFIMLKESNSTLSDMLSVNHPRRKSDLFLLHKAIPGLDGLVLPEEILSKRRDKINQFQPGFSNPVLRNLILGGNYPKVGILKPEKGQDDSKPKKFGPGKGAYLSIIDPIREIVYGKDKNDTQAAGAGGDGSDGREDVSGGGSGVSYANKLLACQKQLLQCSKLRMFQVDCYLNCLLSTHPIGNKVVKVMDSLLEFFCEPLGTVLDWGTIIYEKNAKGVNSLSNFLTLYNIGADSYKQYARSSANAIPTVLMKYSGGSDALLMKGTINGLQTAAKVTNQGIGKVKELMNKACASIDSFDAAQQIANAFYKDPQVVDVTLPGYWSVMKIFELISGPKQGPLKAFAGAINILTGTDCGLVAFGVKGEKQECDKKVTWETEKMLPALKEKPSVCGAVPYFPPDVFDDLYPPIFFPDKPTSTENPTNEGVAGRSNLLLKGDLTWMKELFKTFDNDD